MTRWMRLHNGQMERDGGWHLRVCFPRPVLNNSSRKVFFRWRWWWVLEDGVRNCDKLPLGFLHAPYCQDERVLEIISKYSKTFCINHIYRTVLEKSISLFLYWSHKICCVITQVLTHRTRSSGRCLYGPLESKPLKNYSYYLCLYTCSHPLFIISPSVRWT